MFNTSFLDVPEVEGAAATIKSLNESGEWDIHLISKSSRPTQSRVRTWLHARDFYNRTGLNEGQLHFCENHYEKGLLASQLLLSHFIDDRTKIIEDVPTVPNKLLYVHDEIPSYTIPEGVIVVSSWAEIGDILQQRSTEKHPVHLKTEPALQR